MLKPANDNQMLAVVHRPLLLPVEQEERQNLAIAIWASVQRGFDETRHGEKGETVKPPE